MLAANKFAWSTARNRLLAEREMSQKTEAAIDWNESNQPDKTSSLISPRCIGCNLFAETEQDGEASQQSSVVARVAEPEPRRSKQDGGARSDTLQPQRLGKRAASFFGLTNLAEPFAR